MFERDEEILVQLLLFATGLVFEAFALLDGIVLLGVSRRDFLAVDAALEDFDRASGLRAKVSPSGTSSFGAMSDERRVESAWARSVFRTRAG